MYLHEEATATAAATAVVVDAAAAAAGGANNSKQSVRSEAHCSVVRGPDEAPAALGAHANNPAINAVSALMRFRFNSPHSARFFARS